MKRLIIAIFGIMGITFSLSANPFLEEWVGEFQHWNTYEYIRIQPKEGLANFRIPFVEGTKKFPITIENLDNTNIEFSIKNQSEKWIFEGKFISKNKISGTWTNGEWKGNFIIFNKKKILDEEKNMLLGHYILPSEKVFILWNTNNFFRIQSPVSQQVIGLNKIEENRFFTSSGELFEFSSLENGKFQVLIWRDRNGNEKMAKRFDSYSKEEVTIITSEDTIAGSLFLPNRAGKHPACILVQGAGRFDRSITNDAAEILAANGIATLSYDKPGTGKSGGTVLGKTFEEKRDLTVEIFNWLKKHSKIDSTQIGLKGGSQGGRIATMTAATKPETAFLIAAAAPMESLKETRIFAIHQFLRQHNFSEESINDAIAIWRKYLHQASEKNIQASLVEEIQQLAEKYPNIHHPPASTDLLPNFLPEDIYNATINYLPKVKCPILVINGELDERVPVHNSVHNLRRVLEENEHPDYTIKFYEQANHSFMLPNYRIAKGLFMNQINWLLERVKVNPVSFLSQPEIVLPDLVSTPKTEYAFSLAPDEKTAYFVRRDSFFSPTKSTILMTQLIDNQWTMPKVAPFSGKFSDGDPFITADGERLFFTSNRPTKKGEEKKDKDIWFMRKTAEGWSDPIHIPIVNSKKSEYSPTLTKTGDLYFGSTREGGQGWGDIYFSKWENGSFQTPQNLGKNINTNEGEWGSFISPDGSFIIFEASGRAENLSYSGDLYISYFENGNWLKAQHLGNLNSTGSDLTPKLSPDGNYLYFGSNRHPDIRKEMRNDNVEVYRVRWK